MTWLDLPAGHPFGVHNLPYGVFSTDDRPPRVGTRIGDHVLDLAACAERAGMESAAVWRSSSLNAFLAQGRPAWSAAREWLTEQLTNEAHRDGVGPHLVPLDEVTLHLPVEVADYVDFYASEHHATN
ncbi:MAG: fumarylacetoacetase, partial [Phycicoccus sp.]